MNSSHATSPYSLALVSSPSRAATPVFFSPGRLFSAVELSQLAREGAIEHLFGNAYSLSGFECEARHRALAMSLSLPANLSHRLILGRLSAAWVYTGVYRPPRVTGLLDHRRRSGSLPAFSQVGVHEVAIGRFDVSILSNIRVTTPLRTAVDLLFIRQVPEGWPNPLLALKALINAEPSLNPRLIAAAIQARPRAPYKKQALARLSALSEL